MLTVIVIEDNDTNKHLNSNCVPGAPGVPGLPKFIQKHNKWSEMDGRPAFWELTSVKLMPGGQGRSWNQV